MARACTDLQFVPSFEHEEVLHHQPKGCNGSEVSWCVEPSQPQKTTSGLCKRRNLNLARNSSVLATSLFAKIGDKTKSCSRHLRLACQSSDLDQSLLPYVKKRKFVFTKSCCLRPHTLDSKNNVGQIGTCTQMIYAFSSASLTILPFCRLQRSPTSQPRFRRRFPRWLPWFYSHSSTLSFVSDDH